MNLSHYTQIACIKSIQTKVYYMTKKVDISKYIIRNSVRISAYRRGYLAISMYMGKPRNEYVPDNIKIIF